MLLKINYQDVISDQLLQGWSKSKASLTTANKCQFQENLPNYINLRNKKKIIKLNLSITFCICF